MRSDDRKDSVLLTPDHNPKPSGPGLRLEQGGWLRRLRRGTTTSRTPDLWSEQVETVCL